MTEEIIEAMEFMIANAKENIQRFVRENPSRQWVRQREHKFTAYKRLIGDFLTK